MVALRQKDCQMCVFNPQPVLHFSLPPFSSLSGQGLIFPGNLAAPKHVVSTQEELSERE